MTTEVTTHGREVSFPNPTITLFKASRWPVVALPRQFRTPSEEVKSPSLIMSAVFRPRIDSFIYFSRSWRATNCQAARSVRNRSVTMLCRGKDRIPEWTRWGTSTLLRCDQWLGSKMILQKYSGRGLIDCRKSRILRIVLLWTLEEWLRSL